MDKLLKTLRIKHKIIKPRTPRQNGKEERSHRTDNERFYRFLKFYFFMTFVPIDIFITVILFYLPY